MIGRRFSPLARTSSLLVATALAVRARRERAWPRPPWGGLAGIRAQPVRDIATPALVGYLALNAVAFGIYSPLRALEDIVLLALYAYVITVMTRRGAVPPRAAEDRRRTCDLALVATMTAVAFAGVAVFWLPPGHAMFRYFSERFTSAPLPDVVASRAVNTATAVPLVLIPGLAVIIAFRLPPARCGLRPRYLATGLVVTGISATATGLAALAGTPF